MWQLIVLILNYHHDGSPAVIEGVSFPSYNACMDYAKSRPALNVPRVTFTCEPRDDTPQS